MKFARSQKGLSMFGWLVVLCVVGFLASVLLKIFPHYMDFYSLQKIITSAETESAQQIRSPNDFYAHINRGAEVNNLDLDLREMLDVRMENNEFYVHLNYEKREPLIENLDLVVHFDREYRVRTP